MLLCMFSWGVAPASIALVRTLVHFWENFMSQPCVQAFQPSRGVFGTALRSFLRCIAFGCGAGKPETSTLYFVAQCAALPGGIFSGCQNCGRSPGKICCTLLTWQNTFFACLCTLSTRAPAFLVFCHVVFCVCSWRAYVCVMCPTPRG